MNLNNHSSIKMEKKLFDAFPSITKAEWLDKIKQDLKGKAIADLDWKLGLGLTISPFAHPEDLTTLPPPIINYKNRNTWEIGETILVQDVDAAHIQALQALEGGVNALYFKLTAVLNKSQLAKLLNGIQQEWISTHFEITCSLTSTRQFVEDLLAVISQKQQNPALIKGSIKNDFLNIGELIYFKEIESFLRFAMQALPHFSFLPIDSQEFYRGKENTIQEIAFMLAKANAYLQYFTEDFTDALQFSVVLSESYFLNIAKIRVFKLLWNNIQEAYEVETINVIEAHIAESTLQDDKYQNMISTTTQAMSAVIGGVDRLYIAPADSKEQMGGTTFTRRIARNVQHLLQMESHFDHVVDPAAGSYYIEQLTNKLAQKAWKQFQQIEQLGGYQVQKERWKA